VRDADRIESLGSVSGIWEGGANFVANYPLFGSIMLGWDR